MDGRFRVQGSTGPGGGFAANIQGAMPESRLQVTSHPERTKSQAAFLGLPDLIFIC